MTQDVKPYRPKGCLSVSRRAMIAGMGAIWAAGSLKAAQAAQAASADGTSLSLNGTWQFALAPTAQAAEALAGFHAAGFATKAFRPTPVPSNWAVLGYEEPVYRGFKTETASEGFYLHEFTVPKDWGGKRILLHFGGVWSSAEVWLNDTRLGRHDSGFTSFSFTVSDVLKAGQVNRLAVRVRQVQREYKFDVYDDWTLGGIYRDVTLEAMPARRWIDRMSLETVFDDLYADADLKLRLWVGDAHKSTVPGNYSSPDAEPYELHLRLKDREGAVVWQRQVKVEGHYATNRETRLTARLSAPHQWTAETPYLYDLTVDLVEKDGVSHSRSERVGFREISTKGGVFRINGQAVKLRGVNRHDEHPDVGRATTRAQWIEDLSLMKAANINYIRMAHYAHAPGFIALCDEMGFYVGGEVSIGGGSHHFYDASYMEGALLRTYETVSRDLNRPSVIYWSVGNEDPLTEMHMAAIRTTKGLDPTRPVLLPWRGEDWLPPEVDIIAPHYWKPQEYDALAGRSDRPIITTEYTHAYGTEGMGGLDSRWKALTRQATGAGGAIWMWADQGMRSARRLPDGSIDRHLYLTEESWDGIVDSDRRPTADYWETRAVYAQVYPAVEALKIMAGQASVAVPIRNDFDFTDLSAVRIGWVLMADAQALARGEGTISGQPHAAHAFDLPLTGLTAMSADRTYYVRFIFRHADGTEITRCAVELLATEAAEAPLRPVSALTVHRAGTVSVEVGLSRFVFSPSSGELVSASRDGKVVLSGLTPTLWHRLDENERYMLGKAGAGLPDLDQHTATVTRFEVQETGDGAEIQATVAYQIDAANHFEGRYQYLIHPDGELTVRYEIRPQVQASWVPVVGMAALMPETVRQLKWLGLGPYDAYPNKRKAAMLGVWDWAGAEQDSGAQTGSRGIKATRWIEQTDASGSGLRIRHEGYMEYDAQQPERLRLLSGVVGRPEKGRKADESIPQLLTDTPEPFIGMFSLRLIG